MGQGEEELKARLDALGAAWLGGGVPWTSEPALLDARAHPELGVAGEALLAFHGRGQGNVLP